MRLWHLVSVILLLALVLTLARDVMGRVAVIVFVVGLAEAFAGTTALLALFQTLGAFGEAEGLEPHAVALLATTLVLALATAVMAGLVFVGFWLVALAAA